MGLDFSAVHDTYLPFIRMLASSYPERYREDLIQEGLWGLYLACCAYDASRNVPFDAFIKVCIRNRISSSARNFASDSKTVSLEDQDFPCQDLPLDEKIAENDAVRDFFSSLRHLLSPLEQRVLDQYLSGKSSSQAAQQLGISPKSADNAMTRIKQKVRNSLKP